MFEKQTVFLTVLTMLFAAEATAAEVEGTQTDLTCVYENIDALSLQGLLNPVAVDVQGCVSLFASPVATDGVHAGLSAPDLPVDSAAQLIEERTVLTVQQMERIACKLEEWLATNQSADAYTLITLKLDTDCP